MATSKPPVRALLDACCLLVYITGQLDNRRTARELLERIEDGEVQLVESPTILTEVPPKHESDTGGSTGKRQLIRGLLESDRVDYVDVTTAVARRAGDYMVSYALESMDAIHLATGVHAAVDAVVTLNTQDFPMGETVDGVPVLTPDDFLAKFFPAGVQPALEFDAPPIRPQRTAPHSR